MIYGSADHWRKAPNKRIMLFGMSGLGKTHVSTLLRETGGWFHYSVDYRIGTRYMGEHIADNFKAEAMKVPFLAQLLRTDSIYVASNITFDNLAPLSTYLGKPGDPAKGGLPFGEYMRRQALHAEAEKSAMLDTAQFIERAKLLYGYDHFVCDSSGSIVEVVNPEDPADPVLSAVTQLLLPVWIEGTEAHTEELIRRFDRDPKPMYYRPEFLQAAWSEYRAATGEAEDRVDPDAFVRWAYSRALAHRQPRYAALARNWGVTVAASDIARVRTAEDMVELIAHALSAR
ncbi:ATPase [Palleronia sp. KMU-117]|uniref:ATPase n=1 Tax=Palleronia sp. KMU-117 TaxID=3434108 RepID=UPI003D7531A8